MATDIRDVQWTLSSIRPNPGGLSAGDSIMFQTSNGKVWVSRSGTLWNDRPWVGTTPPPPPVTQVTGTLSDLRPFTATLSGGQVECSIGVLLTGDSEPGKRQKEGDDDDRLGESGGWTAQEGGIGPGRGKKP